MKRFIKFGATLLNKTKCIFIPHTRRFSLNPSFSTAIPIFFNGILLHYLILSKSSMISSLYGGTEVCNNLLFFIL